MRWHLRRRRFSGSRKPQRRRDVSVPIATCHSHTRISLSKQLLWTACAARANVSCPLGVRRQPSDVPTGPKALEKFSMNRGFRPKQRVEVPRALLTDTDQTSPSQRRKVPGNRRLRDAEDRHEITHAELSVDQQMQNPESYRVRECPKHQIRTRRWRRRHGHHGNS